jgi:hypothetical protein
VKSCFYRGFSRCGCAKRGGWWLVSGGMCGKCGKRMAVFLSLENMPRFEDFLVENFVAEMMEA